jgi:hypothetical protein
MSSSPAGKSFVDPETPSPPSHPAGHSLSLSECETPIAQKPAAHPTLSMAVQQNSAPQPQKPAASSQRSKNKSSNEESLNSDADDEDGDDVLSGENIKKIMLLEEEFMEAL